MTPWLHRETTTDQSQRAERLPTRPVMADCRVPPVATTERQSLGSQRRDVAGRIAKTDRSCLSSMTTRPCGNRSLH